MSDERFAVVIVFEDLLGRRLPEVKPRPRPAWMHEHTGLGLRGRSPWDFSLDTRVRTSIDAWAGAGIHVVVVSFEIVHREELVHWLQRHGVRASAQCWPSPRHLARYVARHPGVLGVQDPDADRAARYGAKWQHTVFQSPCAQVV